MEKVIKIINEMEEIGLIGKYCIGGGIATVFYIEPLLTYDIFFFISTIVHIIDQISRNI